MTPHSTCSAQLLINTGKPPEASAPGVEPPWNQRRFQAGRAPDPKANQRLELDSQKSLSQCFYEKDRNLRGGCGGLSHVSTTSWFPNLEPSHTHLLKKAAAPQGYSLCFHDNLPSKNSHFRVTNSTLLEAGGDRHVHEGNHDRTVTHALVMRT